MWKLIDLPEDAKNFFVRLSDLYNEMLGKSYDVHLTSSISINEGSAAVYFPLEENETLPTQYEIWESSLEEIEKSIEELLESKRFHTEHLESIEESLKEYGHGI